MHKRVFGRKFKRDSNERKALFKSLSSAVIINERIKTTEQKAKSVKGSIEKLITKARDEGDKAVPAIARYLNAEALKKLMSDVSLRFKDRPGGYTRIIRLGNRPTDSASMVYLELVEKGKAVAVQKTEKIEKVEKAETKKAKKSQPAKKTTKKVSAK